MNGIPDHWEICSAIVSLATFELFPEAQERGQARKTRLRLTEQGAYFHDPDGHTYAPEGPALSRKRGTEGLLGQLGALFSA